MRLSFKTTALLSITSMGIGVLSWFLSYNPFPVLLFVILTAIIDAIFLVDRYEACNVERDDFRKKIIHETLDILERMAWSTDFSSVPYPVWVSKAEESKIELLGNEDYKMWKEFYNSLEARNEFFRARESFAWQDLEKLNRACFDSFSKVSERISWVKESVPQTLMADLLFKAKRHAMI
jgi:hypothetical protein